MTLLVNEPDWSATLEQAKAGYYKLILIVGPTGSGKSLLLKAAAHYNFTDLNLGEALSCELLSKPLHLRSAEAEELAIDLVNAAGAHRLAIDNTEVLFESPLQLNPLALLKRLSKDRLIVATWTCTFDNSCLYYGIKGHPSYEELAEGSSHRIHPRRVHALQLQQRHRHHPSRRRDPTQQRDRRR